MSESYVIGVRFEDVGKVYYFDASQYPELGIDDTVIVNTRRGKQLASIVKINIKSEDLGKGELKAVERPASPRDLLLRQMLADKEQEAVQIARETAKAAGYQGIKIVSAEYSFDESRLLIMLNIEADPKFNTKRFHQELSRKIKNVRIELQKIGPRDVAKAFGGMGACGLETRCCSKYMTEFNSISIRMAKTQNISLTPSEITGMCGRLRCCLLFEHEYYAEARKNLPKRKKMVQTPAGEGKVIQVLPLSQSVIVNIPEIGPRKFSKYELEKAEMDAQGLVDEEKTKEKAKLESNQESIKASKVEQTQKNNKDQNKKHSQRNRRSRRRK